MDSIAAVRSRDALAFSVLDSEVRLAILDSLYDRTVASGPLAGNAAYSTIKADVGVEDSGRFSYHLDKLTDRFVTKTETGYRLAEPGREVVRLRRTGVLTEDRTVEAEPVDGECYRCGADIQAFYRRGYLVTQCQECIGLIDHELVLDGTLASLAYPPSGVSGIDIGTAFERSHLRAVHTFRAMADGFCPNCGHDVTITLPPAEGEDPGDDGYGFRHVDHDGMVRFACDRCGRRHITHPLYATDDREPMAGFFTRNGIDPGWDRNATVMSWPVTVEGTEFVFETPDGDRFRVDDGLDVRRD
ncbi:hypothetical protein SAMN04488066_103242 [Halorubrum aquaticum]|uniref:Uncharacterized protein n=1 Tax=Halorubrum aquaticum TaxID=387340 RepID=A0A1I2ZZK6_9EURY|nr:helix-turn-helix transcriptional regulator [Halorubrum aquaticum]SFH42511.1 hypothetical protein SAMN04488066_103242 [Halorubrum aquaticum]